MNTFAGSPVTVRAAVFGFAALSAQAASTFPRVTQACRPHVPESAVSFVIVDL